MFESIASSSSTATSPSLSALGFTSYTSSSSSASSATHSAISEKYASIAPPSPSSSSYFQSPRRAFSLPSKLKLPFTSSLASSSSLPSPPLTGLTSGGLGSPMLPLHSPGGRSTARRISYNLKNRASRHAVPLTIGGLFTLAVYIFMTMRTSSEVSRFNSESKLQLYGRSRFSDEEHQHKVHLPDSQAENGVSLLTMNEDELIAEDDLFWDSYTDPEPLTEEEEAAQAELQAHKADVIKQDKMQSLRALIWWLAEGGIIPSNWEVPSKSYLRKVGGRGMERLLEDIDSGEEGDEIFDNGWAEFANKRYRIVVFSKSYCPYSKKAKSILGEYHISPAPFIIELDQRSDMNALQTLLQRITGRRTVPNVLLDFTSIGGSDDVTLLHAEGGLQRRFEEMEVLPYARRRRPVVPAAVVEPGMDVPAPAEDRPAAAELVKDQVVVRRSSDDELGAYGRVVTPDLDSSSAELESESEPEFEIQTPQLDPQATLEAGDLNDISQLDSNADVVSEESEVDIVEKQPQAADNDDVVEADSGDDEADAEDEEDNEEEEEERKPRGNFDWLEDGITNKQRLSRNARARYAPGIGSLVDRDTGKDAWRQGALL
ncbi:glutaredoxin [Kwoniella heveanensis BCC8398]|uniref:Glutaredoxin n=1 Tax=Kwoniella heveanensis BCC8398 TaxID=1296120 RepID=A0A1B9GZC1_9TREE|nr:glutaredoxin [Kwoniella heveanensis BCC8398]